MRPQGICENYIRGVPATARRVVAPYSSEDTSPATMPWVGIVARKAIANSHKPHPLRTNRGLVGLHGKHQPLNTAERKATKHPQQFLTHPCARSEASGAKIKFFAPLSFKKEGRRRPPVKNTLFEVGKAVVFDEDVCGIEFRACLFEIFRKILVCFVCYAVTDRECVAFFLYVYVIVVFCH